MITKEQAQEKIEKGWLQALLAFEVLATDRQTAEDSLKSMIEKLDRDERARIYKKDFSATEEVENPIKGVKTGYSQICEIELISKHLGHLVEIIIEYGPSACEILKPEKLSLSMADAQNILNAIGEMMHRFAEAGLGGVIITTGK